MNQMVYMKRSSLIVFFVAVMSIVTSPGGKAAILAFWDFENGSELNMVNTSNTSHGSGGYTGNTYTNAAPAVGGLTVSSFAAGSGFTYSSGSVGTIGSGINGVGGSRPFVFPTNQIAAANTSATTAISQGDYFSFTLTPGAMYEMSLTEISFYAWSNSADGQHMRFFVSTSIGGASSALQTFSLSSSAVSNSTSPGAANQYTLQLSDFDDLSGLDAPVTFYIGVHRSGEQTPAGNFRLDNVQVQGEMIVVPEASQTLLLMGAVCVLGGRRVRRPA